MGTGRSGACSERERSWRGAGPRTGLTGRERRVPGGAKGFPAAVQGADQRQIHHQNYDSLGKHSGQSLLRLCAWCYELQACMGPCKTECVPAVYPVCVWLHMPASCLWLPLA